MIQPSIQPDGIRTRDRPSRRLSVPPEARGAAPALIGTARPGFVRQAAAIARLDAAGQPLIRRARRLHDGFERRLAGSGLVHGLVLVLLSVMFAQHREGGKMQEQAPVEMLYDRPGTSGMAGPSSTADTPADSPPPVKPPPDLKAPPLPVPTAAPPPPVPESIPLPDMQVPEPLPQAQPQPPQPQPPQPQPPSQVPVRRQAPPSSSPFSHPMDLSFSQVPTPRRAQHGRAAGSSAPMDLSLGPMVQGGRLLTPYASTSSIKGVSDDYSDEIGAWIRRHMYYPEDAAKRGEDGASHVHVVLDRQGRVKSVRLVNSSGSYALDDATQGMFRSAQLPPVPPDMSGNSFDVDLTIDYILIRH